MNFLYTNMTCQLTNTVFRIVPNSVSYCIDLLISDEERERGNADLNEALAVALAL